MNILDLQKLPSGTPTDSLALAGHSTQSNNCGNGNSSLSVGCP